MGGEWGVNSVGLSAATLANVAGKGVRSDRSWKQTLEADIGYFTPFNVSPAFSRKPSWLVPSNLFTCKDMQQDLTNMCASARFWLHEVANIRT